MSGKEVRELKTVVHNYGCYLADQLGVKDHSGKNCNCDCHLVGSEKHD